MMIPRTALLACSLIDSTALTRRNSPPKNSILKIVVIMHYHLKYYRYAKFKEYTVINADSALLI